MDKPNLNEIYHDIYGLIDELQKRPAMYLTNIGKRSFPALIVFVYGLSWTEINTGDPYFWDFIHWITVRVEGMSRHLPWDWMYKEWGNELAFDRFFELLDEYRVCKFVNLRQANSKVYKPTFYTQVDGEIVRPELPLELYIAQFQPSQVYCLLEIYAERQEKEFPYQNSIEEVKQLASSRWKVPENDWLILNDEL